MPKETEDKIVMDGVVKDTLPNAYFNSLGLASLTDRRTP